MDLAKIEQLLKENGLEMKIEIDNRGINAFFWHSDSFEGFSVFSAIDAENELSNVPAIKERIVQEVRENALRKAIETVKKAGLRVEGEAEPA